MPVPSRRLLGSLWRTRSYLRPYAGRVVVMTAAALFGELVPLGVPLITQRLVDGPLRDGDPDALLPLAGLVLAFALAQSLGIFIRRWLITSSALNAEADLRRDLYAHLQRLPVAFHDRSSGCWCWTPAGSSRTAGRAC